MARETAILAGALEEVTTTAMTTAVWRVGSVFFSNPNFMPKNCNKEGNCIKKMQRVCWRRALVQKEGTRGNAAGKSYAMASPWFLG